jgi:hypothetical protein
VHEKKTLRNLMILLFLLVTILFLVRNKIINHHKKINDTCVDCKHGVKITKLSLFFVISYTHVYTFYSLFSVHYEIVHLFFLIFPQDGGLPPLPFYLEKSKTVLLIEDAEGVDTSEDVPEDENPEEQDKDPEKRTHSREKRDRERSRDRRDRERSKDRRDREQSRDRRDKEQRRKRERSREGRKTPKGPRRDRRDHLPEMSRRDRLPGINTRREPIIFV